MQSTSAGVNMQPNFNYSQVPYNVAYPYPSGMPPYMHVPHPTGAPVMSVYSDVSLHKNTSDASDTTPTHLNTETAASSSHNTTSCPPALDSSNITTRCSTKSGNIIYNACLSYMRSLLLRNNHQDVINNTVINFTLDELNDARELLYRQSGTTKYRATSLHDPATAHARSSHCAESIVNKISDLEKTKSLPMIVCAAEDLFRIMDFSSRPTDLECKLEERLSSLERDVQALKSSKSDASFPALPPTYVDVSSRQSLLNKFSQHQSAARERSDSTSKRHRSMDEEPENPNKKKKVPVYWGGNSSVAKDSSDLGGPELHDVFLFNYRINVDDAKVRMHFENVGVKVVFFKRISKDAHYIKNFLMKIPIKDDFQKIIDNLPPRTGARWFVQNSDPRQEPSYFNKQMPVLHSNAQTTPARQSPGLSHQSDRFFTPLASRSHPVSNLIHSSPSIFSPARDIADNNPASSPSGDQVEMATDTESPAVESTIPTSNSFEVLSTLTSPEFAIGGPLSLSHQNLTENEVQQVVTTSAT